MKICIVTPSFVGGGAERIAVNLANCYAAQGLDVVLLAFKAAGPYMNQIDQSVRVIDLNSRTRYVLFKLRKALKNEQPTHILSVIRGSNILLGLYGLFWKNARLVFREASTMNGVEAMPPLRCLLYKTLMCIAYSRADQIIANSDDTKQDLIRHGVVPQQRIVVIGNPVLPPDFEQLANEAVDHPWLLEPQLRVILSVGRLHKLKNQAMLISAFAKLTNDMDNLRLIILGEGEERESLLALAKKLGVGEKMEIVSFRKNPYPFYKNADLFVLTSDWEGFGNVLVEAMACGTPVISTDCPGGPRTILDNGRFGMLVPVGDVDALAMEIVRTLNGAPDADQASAKNHAIRFGIEPVSKEYIEVLDHA